MVREIDEPTMSDNTLLVSVEDLINMAMGPSSKNIVNFKMVQTILHILARNMRLLEQRVEIRIVEGGASDGVHRLSRDKSKAATKVRDKQARDASKSKEREKSAAKEKEKQERAVSKDREKAEKAAAKTEKAAVKDREKAEKEKQKEDKMISKEKEKQKEEKMTMKEKEKAEKDKQKEEKMALKEKDKAEKEKQKEEKITAKEKDKTEKEKQKEEKNTAKEKEKADKMKQKLEKEKEKVDKEKQRAEKDKVGKEQEEKADKASQKDGKKGERGKSKERGKSVATSDTSIIISEVDRKNEKVLVVEKGPTTRGGSRRESIQVVTRSQFELMERAVRELQARAGPLPPPALPDNLTLRTDLVKGSASLTDTMQAMQVTARVKAAEQAIGRMGELLTQLVASGALPQDLATQLEEAQLEFGEAGVPGTPSKPRTTVSRKSVGIQESMGPKSMAKMGDPSRVSMAAPKFSATSRPSTVSSAGTMARVTHNELDVSLRVLREHLTKTIQTLTTKSSAVADAASSTAKEVASKVDVALRLDDRITALNVLVNDYTEQLSGFDTGISTQMQSFRDQIHQIDTELKAGLAQLEQVNSNGETVAVKELTERYEGLVADLDHTMEAHNNLTNYQNKLGDELHGLVECVEMLREQKADRDEVLDGLRDKADNSRLAGLLTSLEFQRARSELENRLEVCHEKFQKQEQVWTTALKDMLNLAMEKAELTQLLSLRDQTIDMLHEIQDQQKKLDDILGEPKAAVVTRELSRGATCAACLTPALMDPEDASRGAPPLLPAAFAHPAPPAAPPPAAPCRPDLLTSHPPDHKEHTCKRWVGGSHTLVSDAVTREHAPPITDTTAPPTKRYTGYGSDGRLYMMEEEMMPCVECNQYLGKVLEETSPEQGAGDQGNMG